MRRVTLVRRPDGETVPFDEARVVDAVERALGAAGGAGSAGFGAGFAFTGFAGFSGLAFASAITSPAISAKSSGDSKFL